MDVHLMDVHLVGVQSHGGRTEQAPGRRPCLSVLANALAEAIDIILPSIEVVLPYKYDCRTAIGYFPVAKPLRNGVERLYNVNGNVEW
jgi:hypothetical protein